MSEEIWRLPKVLRVTSKGRSSVYEAIGRGEFPAPVKLGVRAVGWRRSEIENWIANREKRGP